MIQDGMTYLAIMIRVLRPIVVLFVTSHDQRLVNVKFLDDTAASGLDTRLASRSEKYSISQRFKPFSGFNDLKSESLRIDDGARDKSGKVGKEVYAQIGRVWRG